MDTRLRPSPIRAMLDHQHGPPPIALAAGRPAAELIPLESLAAAAGRAAREPATWRYAGSLGHPGLRAWVAGRLAGRGVAASAEQVLITNGGQHALLLAALALAAPGAAVAVESPGYPGAYQALAIAGAELLALPADPAQLCALAGRRPLALVQCMPSGHNPSGRTLGDGQRQRLVEVCAQHRLTILEDDAYHDLWFDAAPPAPLAARHPRTLIAGSFSKILAPGLRLGWLAVPPELVAAVTLAMQASALHANGLAQATVWEWLQQEDLEAHLARLRAAYRQRRDALLGALARLWPGAQPVPPDGGLFAWLPLPGANATALVHAAGAAGVAALPGGAFRLAGVPDDHLRLCFASEPPVRLIAASAILAAAAGACPCPAPMP